MALALCIIGLVLLLLGYVLIGVILIVIGLALWVAWAGGPGSYGHYRHRGP